METLRAYPGTAKEGETTKAIESYIGQWAPTILIMGLYNKLVKVEGSE